MLGRLRPSGIRIHSVRIHPGPAAFLASWKPSPTHPEPRPAHQRSAGPPLHHRPAAQLSGRPSPGHVRGPRPPGCSRDHGCRDGRGREIPAASSPGDLPGPAQTNYPVTIDSHGVRTPSITCVAKRQRPGIEAKIRPTGACRQERPASLVDGDRRPRVEGPVENAFQLISPLPDALETPTTE